MLDIPRDPLTLYYIYAVLLAFPAARIFRRAGLSPLWTLTLAVPMAGFALAAGALALQKWPAQKRGDA